MKQLCTLLALCILSQIASAQSFFFYEDFSTGVDTVMPAGWVGSANVGNWKCTQSASTTFNALAPINSTSATNNWVIFDSELIDMSYPSTIQNATLTSPLINCATQNVVQLYFEEYYRKTPDSCFVDVSNDGGSTWTTFNVFPNSDLVYLNFTANAEKVVIDISSVAANQANVKFRFRYAAPSGGGLSWLIDDVYLGESLLPADITMYNSVMRFYDATANLNNTFRTIPIQLVSNISCGTYLTNTSSVNVQTALIKREVYNSSNLLQSSQSKLMTNILSGSNVYSFLGINPIPNTVGSYYAAHSVYFPYDIDSTNNKDTFRFNVHETEYAQDRDTSIAAYYLYRPDNPATIVNEFGRWKSGCLYTIPIGKSDTLTDIRVAFGAQTKPGSSLVAHVYHYDGVSYTLQYSSDTVVLTNANIPTTIANVFTNFTFTNYPITSPPILTEGTYMAVVEPISVSGFDTITLRHTEKQFSGITVGFQDSSSVPATFGQTPFYSVNEAPIIRLNFASINSSVCSPTIGISASSNTICEGSVVVFSSLDSNAGSSPTYQWYIDGVQISGATNSSFSSSTINNFDSVHCVIHSNASCVSSNDSAQSNAIYMTVYPQPGFATNSLTPNHTNCELDPLPLYATITPGLTGTIDWYDQNGTSYVNGSNLLFPVGTYTFTAVATAGICTDTFISIVNIPVQPSFTVTVSPSNHVCAGDSISLDAIGNLSFIFPFGIIPGQPFLINATDSFGVFGNDSIGCYSYQSHTVIVDSNQTYSATLSANKLDGATGDTIVFTADIQPSSLTQYNLSWYVNGVYQITNTNPTNTFQHILTSANDSVYAVLTPTAGCFAPDSLMSNVEVIKNVTSVGAFIISDLIKVHPSPFKDYLNIENLEHGDEIIIMDISGRKILETQNIGSNTIQIPMTTLSVGVYLLQINRNHTQFMMKLLKE